MKNVDYKGHSNLADMISTHIENWRDALKIAREHANPPDIVEGTDDRLYWDHEIKALDDIENAVKQELRK
ncbi:hypothetical protein [Escherichia phage vB_EcoS_PJ16]|nr:hypothetical protein [Escherichia phage vB_EcoS_PJ16]